MCAQTTQINRLHNDRHVIPLETSFETMVIEAFGMDESAIGQTTPKRRSARYSLFPKSNSFGR